MDNVVDYIKCIKESISDLGSPLDLISQSIEWYQFKYQSPTYVQ